MLETQVDFGSHTIAQRRRERTESRKEKKPINWRSLFALVMQQHIKENLVYRTCNHDNVYNWYAFRFRNGNKFSFGFVIVSFIVLDAFLYQDAFHQTARLAFDVLVARCIESSWHGFLCTIWLPLLTAITRSEWSVKPFGKLTKIDDVITIGDTHHMK